MSSPSSRSTQQLHERQSFTNDISGVKGALERFKPFGATSLYDAAAATARRLAERSAAHKAIIILTDGIDTSSSMTAPEVSGLASSIDVPVYIVATVASPDRPDAAGRGRALGTVGRGRSPRPGGVDRRTSGVCRRSR